jgi:hypothetical protein
MQLNQNFRGKIMYGGRIWFHLAQRQGRNMLDWVRLKQTYHSYTKK